MRSWRRHFALGLVATLAVAIAVRAGPLWQSPLPFNPDGVIHAINADVTASTGAMPLETLGTDDLLFTSFLATLGSLFDLSPLILAQPVIAVVGAVPCLVAAAAARRIALRSGWYPSRAALAAVLAAGLLAVEGIYLHRSMPVDEQTVGLLFVPLLAVVAAVTVERGERRWLAVAGVLVVALPATHNLDTVIAALALTGLAALAVTARQRGTGPGAGFLGVAARRALLLAAAAWLAFVVYTVGVARLTPASILQSDRLLGVPGLFLAWIVVLVVALPWFYRASSRLQRTIGVGVFAAALAVVLLNVWIPVFPAVQRTPPAIAVAVLTLLALAAVACWAVPTARVGPEGRGLSALVAAVAVLAGLSLSAALTPEYVNLAYRSQTFVHLPVLTAVALGVVGLAARTTDRTDRLTFRRAGALGCALALVLAAASVPVAFGGLSMLSYKGVTTPAEFGASSFADERVPGNWTGDNHVVRVTWANEDVTNGSEQGTTMAPVYDWVVGGGPPPGCPTVVQESWSGVGAQFFPSPPATIADEERTAFVERGNIVYATAGTPDSLTLVVPRGTGDGRC